MLAALMENIGRHLRAFAPGNERDLLKPLQHQGRRLLAAFRSFLALGRFSSLTRRIIVFNVAALFMLLAGILYLNQFREGLIDARRQSLLTQAEIIAGAIAESATQSPEARTFDPFRRSTPQGGSAREEGQQPRARPINPENAAPILRRLVLPTRTRARLYDKGGWLVLDSRQLSESGQILSFELPPPDWQERRGLLDRLYDMFARLLPGRDLPRYREAGSQNGIMYDEVARALAGVAATQERINDRGELIISVAVPIQRYRAVLGGLMLSTQGGDIDALVRRERVAILRVFLVALGVNILLSVLLAATIAEPIRRLASAAEQVRQGKTSLGKTGLGKTNKAEIPDFTSRRDEIGDLSGGLRDMTAALYKRIESIEQFAADVAHELKNPLTSLRSAIETFTVAKDEDQRTRLMEVIKHDIERIDRLITDISDASRLDAELGREEMEEVNIVALLETVVDLFNTVEPGAKKKVALDIETGPAGRDAFLVKGFDTRLGQVMRNLIDNALTFNTGGEPVRVEARAEPGKIIIQVLDRGPGINTDNLEKVFDRFHTDRPGAFGRHSGLGLSISKQIIEAHRGLITAGNRPGGGACFSVELPAEKAPLKDKR